MFDADSRYATLPTRVHLAADGREIVYVSRRFLPRRTDLVAMGRVTVAEADRLDLVAARTLGTPEAWWRLPDANLTLHPEDLEQTGTELIVASEAP